MFKNSGYLPFRRGLSIASVLMTVIFSSSAYPETILPSNGEVWKALSIGECELFEHKGKGFCETSECQKRKHEHADRRCVEAFPASIAKATRFVTVRAPLQMAKAPTKQCENFVSIECSIKSKPEEKENEGNSPLSMRSSGVAASSVIQKTQTKPRNRRLPWKNEAPPDQACITDLPGTPMSIDGNFAATEGTVIEIADKYRARSKKEEEKEGSPEELNNIIEKSHKDKTASLTSEELDIISLLKFQSAMSANKKPQFSFKVENLLGAQAVDFQTKVRTIGEKRKDLTQSQLNTDDLERVILYLSNHEIDTAILDRLLGFWNYVYEWDSNTEHEVNSKQKHKAVVLGWSTFSPKKKIRCLNAFFEMGKNCPKALYEQVREFSFSSKDSTPLSFDAASALYWHGTWFTDKNKRILKFDKQSNSRLEWAQNWYEHIKVQELNNEDITLNPLLFRLNMIHFLVRDHEKDSDDLRIPRPTDDWMNEWYKRAGSKMVDIKPADINLDEIGSLFRSLGELGEAIRPKQDPENFKAKVDFFNKLFSLTAAKIDSTKLSYDSVFSLLVIARGLTLLQPRSEKGLGLLDKILTKLSTDSQTTEIVRNLDESYKNMIYMPISYFNKFKPKDFNDYNKFREYIYSKVTNQRQKDTDIDKKESKFEKEVNEQIEIFARLQTNQIAIFRERKLEETGNPADFVLEIGEGKNKKRVIIESDGPHHFIFVPKLDQMHNTSRELRAEDNLKDALLDGNLHRIDYMTWDKADKDEKKKIVKKILKKYLPNLREK